METGAPPGLVKPYEGVYVNELPSCKVQRNVSKNNPYSVYDDDDGSPTEHYFFVPAIRPGKDLHQFRKAFIQMNNSKNSISQTQHQRPTRLVNNSSCRFQHSSATKHLLPSSSSSNGDYCSIKHDAKGPRFDTHSSVNTPHCVLSSANTRIKKENLQQFASKFTSTENSYLSHKASSTDSPLELSDTTWLKTKNSKSSKVNKYIDYCTCMVCVRSVSYHFTADDTDEYTEPCSCTGSRKSVVGRWLCMGVLALFLPCLYCYIPAKACQNSCKGRTKRNAENEYTKVTFIKDNNGNTERIKL